ncbi:MAG: 50S ribosomal protein L19 [Bacteroidota bacterium]|nr:50S ribosomal protein L19 [Bacteroidota bacterium]
MSSADFKLTKENTEILKSFPDFGAGDTINVHIKIKEGNKERIQQFQGTVLQRKNPGTNGETFTLRKISDSIAVEKIMPIFSPSIDKIELVRKGKVRRARIFYLRDRKGKSAKIKERL